MPFSAKLPAYSDNPSEESQSVIVCVLFDTSSQPR